jgi:hypothetical protein
VEKVARIVTFEEAEQLDREFYLSLTPEQRMEMMLELLDYAGPDDNGAAPRLERVYRVVEQTPG